MLLMLDFCEHEQEAHDFEQEPLSWVSVFIGTVFLGRCFLGGWCLTLFTVHGPKLSLA